MFFNRLILKVQIEKTGLLLLMKRPVLFAVNTTVKYIQYVKYFNYNRLFITVADVKYVL